MAEYPGDIMLDGKHYKVDLASYKGKDIIDFAPRAATPGGSVVMSDLNLYQPLLTTDWKHGFGFSWHTEPQGYLSTIGNIDTRHTGRVMMDAKSYVTDSAAGGERYGYEAFNNAMYSYGVGGLRRESGLYSDVSWETPTFSAIEQLSTSSASASGNDELTFPHTIQDLGQSRLLIVRVGTRGSPTVTGVTYGGQALTELANVGAGPRAYIFYLKEPTSGTADVVVSLSGAGSMEAAATTYLYVHQTTTFGTPASTSGTGTSSSIAVSSAASEVTLDILSKQGPSSDAIIIGANQTQDFLKNVGGTNSAQGAGSYEAGAATNTMTWSWTNSRSYAALGVSIKPATLNVENDINFALATEDYLFYCPNAARIRKISAAGVDSAAGLNSSSIGYKWLIMHKGFIYAGKEGNSHRVHYSDQGDLSDLEGTTADPDAIYVGIGNIPTKGAIVYAGNLYVARKDGLWHIGDDNIARNVIDFSKEQAAENFESMVVYNGLLVFPIRDHVYQWNGSRISDITPNPLSDVFPYRHYQAYTDFKQGGGHLYCVGKTSDASYPAYHLLSWDGASWHKLLDMTDGSSSTTSITAMYFDARRNQNTASDTILYALANDPTYQTYAWYPSYRGEFPYPNFPTTGQHALITSRLDMGFRRVVKSATSLLVEASNITATRYLKVYYSLDGGDWVFWADIKHNGVWEIRDPGGYHSVEFNYMQLRIEFVTATATQTPVLESYTLRFIMRPDVRFGYSFNVIAAPNLEHGRYPNAVPPSKVVKTLRELRNSKPTIDFVDILGDHYHAYISSMTEIPRERGGEREGGALTIEYLVSLNVVVM